MTLAEFLAHAIRLEADALRIYGWLADAYGEGGNAKLADFFGQMAGYSRLHLQQTLEHAGVTNEFELAATVYLWPDGTSPEAIRLPEPGADTTLADAMRHALEAERRAHGFYSHIAATATDAAVRAMAAEFTAEEAEHVTAMERMLGRLAVDGID